MRVHRDAEVTLHTVSCVSMLAVVDNSPCLAHFKSNGMNQSELKYVGIGWDAQPHICESTYLLDWAESIPFFDLHGSFHRFASPIVAAIDTVPDCLTPILAPHGLAQSASSLAGSTASPVLLTQPCACPAGSPCTSLSPS